MHCVCVGSSRFRLRITKATYNSSREDARVWNLCFFAVCISPAAAGASGSAIIRIFSFSLPLVSAELSPYELHRKPHEMVTDSTVVAVSPRALRSELMCPICLDLMKNPLTTKEVRSPAITTSMLVFFYSQYLHYIAS